MGIPSKLKNFNTFLDGVSYLGEMKEVSLPKLAMKAEAWRGGGMLGEIDIDLGLEKIEFEFTAGGFLVEPLLLFGSARHDAAMIRFAGAYQSDSTARVEAFEITVRGRYAEIDMGKGEAGANTEHKYKMSASYYRLTRDGEELMEIDLLGGTFVVGGIDRYAEVRAAIGA